MVHAKNYETVTTFVKVMQRKLLASFFGTRCSGNLRKIRTSEHSDVLFTKSDQHLET